jgi:hypothetical protein
MILARTFDQDIDAKLDYDFDWNPWLDDVGDTIASFAITAATGITVTSSSTAGGVVTVWITLSSTLIEGQVVTLACRITTTAGRIDERTIGIQVVQL